jgi:hypothetical protein
VAGGGGKSSWDLPAECPPADPKSLACFVGAGGEIDLFTAFGAFVGFVKFVGKNLFGCVAFGAFTGKGFQLFKIFKSGAVFGGAHGFLLAS